MEGIKMPSLRVDTHT